MSFNIYGDFDPDAKHTGNYVEFTENDMYWGNDVQIPSGSYYRYSSEGEWSYTKSDTMVYLCCSGDYIEVVEPGPPSKKTVYAVI